MNSYQSAFNWTDRPPIYFTVVSSNKELQKKLDEQLKRKGYVGMIDMNGAMNYYVEGRRGAAYALAKIQSVTDTVADRRDNEDEARLRRIVHSVDDVLRRYAFDRGLQGYLYLRFALCKIALDHYHYQPLSKRLYPFIAEAFGVNAEQVNRNIRYLVSRLFELEKGFEEHGVSVVREGQASAASERITLHRDLSKPMSNKTLFDRLSEELRARTNAE